MKTLHLVLWIFILYIIQNVFYPIVAISGFVPDLLLGFAVSYCVLEHKFDKISKVLIVCAILAGTGTGRVFPLAVLFSGFAGIFAYRISDYLRFIPLIVRTLSVTAISSFIICIAEYFVFSRTITVDFILNTALWHTLYTTAITSVIYLLLRRAIYKDTEKKLLIAQERN